MSNPHHPDEGPDEGHEMELVLPFVATESHGGPYQDESFVAGYATAQLDLVLQLAAGALVTSLEAMVRVALVPQLDLIGMRWGYTTSAEPILGNPDWCRICFTTASGEDPT